MSNIVYMPDAEDDRTLALSWYCRRLLLDEMHKGYTQADMGRRTKLSRSAINQALIPQGVGSAVALRLAEYFRMRDAGELWSQALDWWERVGRQEAADELKARSEAAANAARKAADDAKKKRGRPPKPKLAPVNGKSLNK